MEADQGCWDGVDMLGAPRKQQQTDSNVDVSILVQELNSLSVKEREDLLDEIHGVAKVPDETPELISECLKEFQEELLKLPRNKRKTLDRALFLKPSLEHDNDFKLMFLRADRFEASKAVWRMATYFEYKMDLFGEEKLVKKITLDDMSEDDMEAFHSGSFQILPEKDRAGRTVWFFALQDFKYKHWRNYIRYCWYQIMAMLEDKDAQIHGMVDISYCVGMTETEISFTDLVGRGFPLLLSLPFRMCAIHFCFSEVRLKLVLSLAQLIAGMQNRMRFRTHFGSDLEVRYALMTFGIPLAELPMNADGSLKMELYHRYIQERVDKEAEWKCQESNQSKQYVAFPNRKDILLGRGKPYQDYHGNQRLAQIVDLYRERYRKATERFEKMCISTYVVKRIQESGGRFLQRKPEGWEEVSDLVALQKVGQALRCIKQTTIITKTINATNPEQKLAPSTSKRIRCDEQLLHDFDPF